MSLNAASDELRETFKLALRRFPAAVSVITSADQNRRHGMTATAVTSLSLDPPSLIVCINQSTLLHDIMLLARRFCVNVLRRDQAALSSAFSGAIPAEERFRLGDWTISADGVTYLADAQINIFCKKAAAGA
jgi:flavin reductase (DIM6/NTAB) family NADH-FMN oxidoreductase RutF